MFLKCPYVFLKFSLMSLKCPYVFLNISVLSLECLPVCKETQGHPTSLMISLGKQSLNNNKHIKLNSNVDSILTGIRQEKVMNTIPLNTEGEGLINLNIPEHLKTSQKEN